MLRLAVCQRVEKRGNAPCSSAEDVTLGGPYRVLAVVTRVQRRIHDLLLSSLSFSILMLHKKLLDSVVARRYSTFLHFQFYGSAGLTSLTVFVERRPSV